MHFKGDGNWRLIPTIFSLKTFIRMKSNTLKNCIGMHHFDCVYAADILWFFDICTIFRFKKQTSKGSSFYMNEIYLQVKLELYIWIAAIFFTLLFDLVQCFFIYVELLLMKMSTICFKCSNRFFYVYLKGLCNLHFDDRLDTQVLQLYLQVITNLLN